MLGGYPVSGQFGSAHLLTSQPGVGLGLLFEGAFAGWVVGCWCRGGALVGE